MSIKLNGICDQLLIRNVDKKCGKGFFYIYKNWSTIVGSNFAKNSKPLKITFSNYDNSGVLHIQVDSGAMSVNLRYIKKNILEQSNLYFGYLAITELKLILS